MTDIQYATLLDWPNTTRTKSSRSKSFTAGKAISPAKIVEALKATPLLNLCAAMLRMIPAISLPIRNSRRAMLKPMPIQVPISRILGTSSAIMVDGSETTAGEKKP